MSELEIIERVGLIASASMPLFNIPLIRRMRQRKCADDFSMAWVWGVFACSLLMMPQALLSKDVVFKAFGITNITLFSVVTFLATYYRFKRPEKH